MFEQQARGVVLYLRRMIQYRRSRETSTCCRGYRDARQGTGHADAQRFTPLPAFGSSDGTRWFHTRVHLDVDSSSLVWSALPDYLGERTRARLVLFTNQQI
ncbi:Hypothetical predicted protein [Xyrichtys novacula]|uniref:Uncharacterized protein n=1 Tax=Xyrichtys novacula TaxID=13765 RepID=A0AAV1GKG0_XYRNO|nr:Hypothetical predicted protein [Xyrichtys novacula]